PPTMIPSKTIANALASPSSQITGASITGCEAGGSLIDKPFQAVLCGADGATLNATSQGHRFEKALPQLVSKLLPGKHSG
ncbi:MAG: hypothetical protein AB1725_12455, partial [Armatimonadota bacterium]